MKLKGNMVIEMIDDTTGDVVERVEEENMVTNAVNHILGLNPMGIFYKMGGQYDTALVWNDNLIPICPNMIGGILLYSDTLTEDTENIYESCNKLPIAYASNDVNATPDVQRGSMNLTESKALENGYRFVWEFTPSQGNGTIAAVALTSKQGGVAHYGTSETDKNTFFMLSQVKLESQSTEELAELYSAVEVDFENNCFINLQFKDSSVIMHRRRLPVFTLGLNDKLNDTTNDLIEEQVLHCSTFKFISGYTPFGDFLDGHDGYWYGFANSPNGSGNATMYWIKIKKDDYSFTEGVWTLANAKLKTIGSFKVDTYAQRGIRGVIRKGYLYLQSYDNKGIYKINVNNPTDITLLDLGFTTANKSMSASGTCDLYMAMVNDLIIGYDFLIKPDDTIIQISGSAKLPYIGTPLFQYKEFIFGWGGNYGSDYRNVYLLTPYLATINNLSKAVVKTTEKTMKITYELIEED